MPRVKLKSSEIDYNKDLLTAKEVYEQMGEGFSPRTLYVLLVPGIIQMSAKAIETAFNQVS